MGERTHAGREVLVMGVRSSQAGVLRDAVATVTPHEVTAIGPQLDGFVDVLPLPSSHLVFVRYGGDVLVEAPPTQQRVVATVPLGTMQVSTGNEASMRGMDAGFLLGAQERTFMRPDPWAGALVLAADETRINEHRKIVLGDDTPAPLAGDASPLLTTACKRAWSSAAQLDDSIPMDVVSLMYASLESELLTALALSWDHTRTASFAGQRGRAHELRAWLEEHHGIEITIADMARHTGLSVRQLQVCVAEQLNMTPTQLLRSVRLEHARRMLHDSDVDRTTVARVAHDCGFAHLGRFSAYYFEAFGEAPSTSLRKGHRSR